MRRLIVGLLSLVALLALCSIAGFAGAAALGSSVPAVRDGCNSGVVCFILNLTFPQKADDNPVIPGPDPGPTTACLTPDDQQKIQRLGEVLTTREKPGAPLSFGAGCVSVSVAVEAVCQAMVGDLGVLESCNVLKP